MRLLPLLAASLVASPLAAQAVAGIDHTGTLTLWSGQGNDAQCNYPGGSLLGQWSYVQGSPCTPIPAPAPDLPSLLGDVAMNRTDGTFWATDGFVIAESTQAGTTFNGWDQQPGSAVPGPITGMGFDFLTYGLWITDGTSAAQIQPPQPENCTAGAPVIFPAFALPIAPGATATDIDWDPITQSLFVVDDTGFLTQVIPGGALGPLGSNQVTAPACFGFGTVLTGLAVDKANPSGAVYVTDSDTVTYIDTATGGPAAPTFYMPTPCQSPPVPGSILGLAFRGFGVGYAKASNGPVSPFLPVMGANSEPYAGNTGFTLTVAGQQQNEVVSMFASGGALCPTFPIFGVDVAIDLGSLINVGTVFTAGPAVPVDFAVPLPSTLGAGFPVWFQGFAVDLAPTFHVSSTGGFHITTSLQ